jgi:hypothetical protein
MCESAAVDFVNVNIFMTLDVLEVQCVKTGLLPKVTGLLSHTARISSLWMAGLWYQSIVLVIMLYN